MAKVGGEDALQDTQLPLLQLLAFVAVEDLAHVPLLAIVHDDPLLWLFVDPIQVHVRCHDLPQLMLLHGL